MIFVTIKYGSDTLLTFSDVPYLTTTSKPTAHLLALVVDAQAETLLFDKFTVASLSYGRRYGRHFKLAMAFKLSIVPQSLNDMHRVASLWTTRFILQSRVHTRLNTI